MKRYTREENEFIFNTVYSMAKDNKLLQDYLARGYINATTTPVVKALNRKITDRTADALLVQASMVVCGIWHPDRRWGKQPKAKTFRSMYEAKYLR
jgi:hypothetical protein